MTEYAIADVSGRTILKYCLTVVGTALGVAAAGLAVSVGFGDAIFVPLGSLLLGVGVWYGSWHAYKQTHIVRGTPTSKVRSMAVGAVELKGDAHPVDEPEVSPLTHTDACMFALDVKRRVSSGSSEGSWATVVSLREHVPFELDDGTGRVRVEPDSAKLAMKVEEEVAVAEGEQPPSELEEWVQDRALPSSHVESQLLEPSDEDRRFEERVLAAGESAYVFGGAEPREDVASPENPENLVIRRDDGTDRFIVSDKSESQLVADKLWKAANGVGFGIILFAYALGLILRGLGLV